MHQTHSITSRERRDKSPLIAELESLFTALPSEKLVDRLREYRWTGRPGHSLQALWWAFIASFYLNLPHTNAVIRRLQDDPLLRQVCGFGDVLPSRWTFNRFLSRLSKHLDLVEECLSQVTDALRRRLPRFGDTVAVDSSMVRSHSNPNKPEPSDPEATWTAKQRIRRKGQDWFWGFKLHLVADAEWELPIAGYVSTAKENDTKHLLPLMAKAKESYQWFAPKHVLADKGYDATSNYREIAETYHAIPIIRIRSRLPGADRDIYDDQGVPHCLGNVPMRLAGRDPKKGTLFRCRPEGCHLKYRKGVIYCDGEEWVKPSDDYRLFCEIPRSTPEWQALYHRRVSVERIFSRLKETRRLERHCLRGLAKISLHAMLSVLVLQADALTKVQANRMGELRACTRKVA